MKGCGLCPRLCGVSRENGQVGLCGQGTEMRVARVALHPYEEPPISGTRGSGTVFFCGCPLGCVFCQNRAISRSEELGRALSPEELADRFLFLQEQGAHNINLVTPTHFTDGILRALEISKCRLTVPVVWNSSGYERVETLRRLEGLVEIYLPDWKYASPEAAANYSAAPDYPSVAAEAIAEMYRQVGRFEMGTDGLLRKGLLVRHLVLPGGREDSMAVLERLAALLPVDGILLSLMSQYTPEFAMDSPHRELHRRVTSFEYDRVLARAEALGFDGFFQRRASATSAYTPDFRKSEL